MPKIKSVTARMSNPCRNELVLISGDAYESYQLTNYSGLGFTYYNSNHAYYKKDEELFHELHYHLPDVMIPRLLGMRDEAEHANTVAQIFDAPWDTKAETCMEDAKDLVHTISLIKYMDMPIIDAIIKDFGVSLDDPYISMLKPHQKQALALYITLGYCCNFGQMRTGKTPPSIQYMYASFLKGDINRVIVIVPAGIKNIWHKELAHFLPPQIQMLSQVIEGPKAKRKDLWKSAGIFKIVSYATFRNDLKDIIESLEGLKYGLVVDEVHNIKNASQRSMAVRILVKSSNPPQRMIGISGTPVANKPEDIARPLGLIAPNMLGRNYDDFAQTYCWTNSYNGKGYVTGYRKDALDEIYYRLARVSVRAMRADCNMDLGVKFEPQELDMSESQAKVHDDLMGVFEAELYNPSTGSNVAIFVSSFLAKLQKCQEVTAGFIYDGIGNAIWLPDQSNPKLEWLDNFIQAYMPYEKLVIACKFTETIKRLMDRYRKWGCVAIWGGTKQQDRLPLMEQFQSDPETHIAILNTHAAEGLDLNPAVFMVQYTRDFQLKANMQMGDRITGFRQVAEATIMPLVCNDSIDSNLEEVLAKKEVYFNKVVNGEGTLSTEELARGVSITKDDLFALVKRHRR